MDLPTYTSIWKTRRIFYKIEDIRLPVPVPADVLLLTAVCFAIWDGFWWAAAGAAPFRAAAGSTWLAAAACWYILPPFFAARMIARPNREGKNIPQVIASRARYMLRPKELDGYVSQRHIQAWLKARDRRAAIPRARDMAAAAARTARALTAPWRWARRQAGAGMRRARAAVRRRAGAAWRLVCRIARTRMRLVTYSYREGSDEDPGAR